MAGLTNFASKQALDFLFPTSAATSYIAWSVNGTTEFSGLARTAVGATGWSAATSADPSVKTNSGALVSAAASSGGSVSHYAIFDASTSGNQLVDWTALASPRTVVTGDQLTVAVSQISVTQT